MRRSLCHVRDTVVCGPAGLRQTVRAVPGWTSEAGQFGAASYTFPNGWFSKTSKGSPSGGRKYFFGGTTTDATSAKATIGKQTIKLPAAAAGRNVTLGGWLGNYGSAPSANMTQVRAEFADGGGTVLARLRIGDDTTISGTDMAFRSRKAPSRAEPPRSRSS